MDSENTFIMIKPDGVRRRLVSKIVKRFEEKGLTLTAAKCMMATDAILRTHYGHLVQKPFFNSMVEDMMSGMVFAMVWTGSSAVETGRALIGETDPRKAAAGTIRGDYGINVDQNVVHGSDSVENARKEISLWLGSDVQLARL